MPTSASVVCFHPGGITEFLLIKIRSNMAPHSSMVEGGCQGSGCADMSCPFVFLWETARNTLAGGTSLGAHAHLLLIVALQPALTANLAPLDKNP